MVDKRVSIRIAAVGGKEVVATFDQIGTAGSAGLNRFAGAQANVGAISSDTTDAVRNAAFQFNDFFVQVGAGTSVTQAFAQQLPQLVQGFGLFGAGLGVAAAAMIPLVGYLTSAGEEALTLDEAVDGVVASLDQYIRFTEISATSTAELREKFGEFAEEVRGFAEYMQGVSLGQALDGLDKTIEPLRAGLLDVIERLGQLGAAQEALGRIDPAQADTYQLYAESVATYQAALDEATDALGLTAGQAVALSDALAAVGEAQGVEAVAAAAFDALGLLESMVANGQELSPVLADAAVELERLASKAAEADTAAANAVVSFDDIAGAAGNASGIVGGLTSETYGLAAAAAAAANNFFAMIGAARANAAAQAAIDPENFRLAGAYGLYADTRGAAPDVAPVARPVRGRGGGGRRGGGGGGRDPNADDLREAERLYEATRTEAEKYSAEVENLNRLLAEGDINASLHARAMGDVAEKYKEAAEEGLTFEDAIKDISSSLIDAARNGENLGDALVNTLADIAAELAKTQLNKLLMNAFAPILGSFGLSPTSPILSAGPAMGLGGAAAAAKALSPSMAARKSDGVVVNFMGGGIGKDDAEVRQSTGPSGERQIEIMIKKVVKGGFSRGDFDPEMRHFGMKRVPA